MANLDCLHANSGAHAPSPHDFPQHPVSASTIIITQVFNFGGRGGPLDPGSPRPKSALALDKKYFSRPQDFSTNPVGPGRAGGVGLVVLGLMAGPIVPDPAHRVGVRRAGAERTCGVRRWHRDHPVPWRHSLSFAMNLVSSTSCDVPGHPAWGLSPGSVVPFVRGLHFAPGWSSWVESMVRSSSPGYS